MATTPWEKSGMRILGGRYVTLSEPRVSENTILTYAREVATGVQVVIKRPTQRLLSYPSFAYQLERAALDLVDVTHENLVPVLDVRREDGVPCVVSEYVGGISLAMLIQEGGGTLTADEIQPWLFPIADALDFIHGMKSVHGEVRPGHILQDEQGVWKLTDLAFSTARETLDQSLQSALVSKRPGFTAPELQGGLAPTAATDQYSLAACMYMALVGEPPSYDLEVAAKALRRHITIDVAVYLLRALSPNPRRRYASCRELAQACDVERQRSVLQTQLDEAASGAAGDAGTGGDEESAGPERRPAAEASAQEEPERRIWRLRVGAQDEYARTAREGDFVALGWGELGELESLGDDSDSDPIERLADRYEEIYGQGGLAARVGAGQVWRFTKEIQNGDLVVVPDSAAGVVHVGEIRGDVVFVSDPDPDCPLPRLREVRWMVELDLQELAPSLRARLVGNKPLVDLDADRLLVMDALESAAVRDDSSPPDSEVQQAVGRALRTMSDDAFVAFLRGLFAAFRYDLDLVLGGGEHRWEVVGTLAGEGLVEVPLRTTVYRNEAPLDSDVVFTARGTLAGDEHAAIIALGGFTDEARVEAAEDGKKPVRLIDGPLLTALTLQRWQDLRAPVRASLGIEQVEQVSIETWFRPLGGEAPPVRGEPDDEPEASPNEA